MALYFLTFPPFAGEGVARRSRVTDWGPCQQRYFGTLKSPFTVPLAAAKSIWPA
jgi:hypothetical protein